MLLLPLFVVSVRVQSLQFFATRRGGLNKNKSFYVDYPGPRVVDVTIVMTLRTVARQVNYGPTCAVDS